MASSMMANKLRAQPVAAKSPPAVVCAGALLPARPSRAVAQSARSQRRQTLLCAAVGEQQEVKEVSLGAPASTSEDSNDWTPVCVPEDIPKGTRKEFEVDGRQVLVFWYRNQLYCIEARSPAEGAYSEGFIKAKFTQDYCIECPGTGSLFSLKDGSIVSWYPNNAVLRALTPASLCRPLEIYPVKLAQEAIYIDVSRGTLGGLGGRGGKGGSNTSVEGNNVFSVQPTVYFEGMDPTVEAASLYAVGPDQKANPASIIAGVVAVASFAVAGTALAVLNENFVALGVFWLVLGGGAGYAGYKYVTRGEQK